MITTGIVWTVDSDGRILTETSIENGLPASITTNSWAGDILLSNTTDEDADGQPEFVLTQTVDAFGRLSTSHTDADGDGTPEYGSSVVYTCPP